jgi:hypothetical protein
MCRIDFHIFRMFSSRIGFALSIRPNSIHNADIVRLDINTSVQTRDLCVSFRLCLPHGYRPTNEKIDFGSIIVSNLKLEFGVFINTNYNKRIVEFK